MRLRSSGIAATAGAAVLLAGTTSCTGSATGHQEPSGQRTIGIDLPRDDSDFWNAYGRYLRDEISQQSVPALPITKSHGDAE